MTRPLSIRLAVAGEREALETLQWRSSLNNSGDRDALLANPDAIVLPVEQIVAGRVFVAERDDGIVGFAALLPRADGETELDGLFVAPGHSGDTASAGPWSIAARRTRLPAARRPCMWSATRTPKGSTRRAASSPSACKGQRFGTGLLSAQETLTLSALASPSRSGRLVMRVHAKPGSGTVASSLPPPNRTNPAFRHPHSRATCAGQRQRFEGHDPWGFPLLTHATPACAPARFGASS